MPTLPLASDAARSVLSHAARRLMTADPSRDGSVSAALDHALGWPLADSARIDGTRRFFEPSFHETDRRALAFQVRPLGPGVTTDDQREITNATARRLIHDHFGRDPLDFFDRRSETARARYGAAGGMGARYALGLGADGLREVQASYEWGPGVIDMLPAQVLDLARTVMTAMQGLTPFATAIRTSRHSGGQQVSFSIDADTPLDAFAPLMEALGMGHRHGGFVTLLAFVLGARFTLPAGSAALTVLNTRQGPEMRLDVNIDALPDTPQQLLPLLRLPMTERPANLAALDTWLAAMTPEGYYGPGSVTVLSVRVRPEMPARLALFLRPVAIEHATAADPGGAPAPQPALQ
jgi:hypothetical protein